MPSVSAIIKSTKLDGSYDCFICTDEFGLGVPTFPLEDGMETPQQKIRQILLEIAGIDSQWAKTQIIDCVDKGPYNDYTICYLTILPYDLRLVKPWKFTNVKDLAPNFIDWKKLVCIGIHYKDVEDLPK